MIWVSRLLYGNTLQHQTESHLLITVTTLWLLSQCTYMLRIDFAELQLSQLPLWSHQWCKQQDNTCFSCNFKCQKFPGKYKVVRHLCLASGRIIFNIRQPFIGNERIFKCPHKNWWHGQTNTAMVLCISWGYLVTSTVASENVHDFYCKIMIPQVYRLTENHTTTCTKSIVMNSIQHVHFKIV